jgi:hypothetical protein
VGWVDPEWLLSYEHALSTLWDMYENSNTSRVQEKIHNTKFLKTLSKEKNFIEKKYTSLLVDIKNFMDITEKHVVQKNMANMKRNCDE